jgi:hypothetical protein
MMMVFMMVNNNLVGGIPTPLKIHKNMKVSWGYYSQYMETCSKPPTSYVCIKYLSIWIHKYDLNDISNDVNMMCYTYDMNVCIYINTIIYV